MVEADLRKKALDALMHVMKSSKYGFSLETIAATEAALNSASSASTSKLQNDIQCKPDVKPTHINKDQVPAVKLHSVVSKPPVHKTQPLTPQQEAEQRRAQQLLEREKQLKEMMLQMYK
jgi:hypothetical protein